MAQMGMDPQMAQQMMAQQQMGGYPPQGMPPQHMGQMPPRGYPPQMMGGPRGMPMGGGPRGTPRHAHASRAQSHEMPCHQI